MLLQDLPEDVLGIVLAMCDVCAVLSMSRTNHFLRRQTQQRLLWVHLVQDLCSRGFIDRGSKAHVSTCSHDALVDLVKRLLKGPSSWTPTRKRGTSWSFSRRPSQPSIIAPTKQVVLHPPDVIASKENEARLLPGGEFLLFNNRTLELWRVRDDKIVWSLDTVRDGLFVCQFGAEIRGETVSLIVCQRNWPQEPEQAHGLVRVITIDGSTGLGTVILEKMFMDISESNFKRAKICGRFSCVLLEEFESFQGRCILFDSESGQSIELPSRWPIDVALIPDQAVLLTSADVDAQAMSIGFVNLPAQFAPDRPAMRTVPLSVVSRSRDHSIFVLESPIEAGVHRVRVKVSGFVSPSVPSIITYSLLLRGSRCTFEGEVRHETLPRDGSFVGLTYSGHLAMWRTNPLQSHKELTVLAPGASSPAVLKDCPAFSTVSPYTGTICYWDFGGIYISYYS